MTPFGSVAARSRRLADVSCRCRSWVEEPVPVKEWRIWSWPRCRVSRVRERQSVRSHRVQVPWAFMRVSLFVTCLGDRFFADAAEDAVRLLRALGVDVDFPPGQTCCGQPAWNAGHRARAEPMAAHTTSVFADSEYVVLPSGSCTSMIRNHYPDLVGEDPTGLPGRVFELAEFIVGVLGITELGSGLEGRRLAYHHGCHALRELGEFDQPLCLLKSAGAEVVPWEASQECCGFGGLFSVKAAPVSLAMADRKLDTLPAVDTIVSADGGCLLQLGGRAQFRGLDVAVKPLASALWEAHSATA
jgi:L-lactate dehydrogenase complex protein LldE